MHRQILITIDGPKSVSPDNMHESQMWAASGLAAMLPQAGYKLRQVDYTTRVRATFLVEGWIDDDLLMLVTMKYDVAAFDAKIFAQ